ncbi:unnamed protein product, partial [Meganyctiphanes norvegica]
RYQWKFTSSLRNHIKDTFHQETSATSSTESDRVSKLSETFEEYLKNQFDTNIPIEMLMVNKSSQISKSLFVHKNYNLCPSLKFPLLGDIQFNNTYWQYLKTKMGKIIYIYSAYYDNRSILKNNPVIRILAMSNEVKRSPDFGIFCHIWSKDKRFVLTTNVSIIRLAPLNYQNCPLRGYLITCEIPQEIRKQVPTAVSLAEDPCLKVKNVLRVINNQPEGETKKDFAVCLKGFDFVNYDISIYLVEWLELISLLGIHKVYLYNLNLHPNMSKVLNYYRNRGLVHVTPLTLAGNVPNIPKLQHDFLESKANQLLHEKIPFHDCFYMNMNRYNYIAVLDIDEIILPVNAKSWRELIKDITKRKNNGLYTNFLFRRNIVLDEMRQTHGYDYSLPSYMYMLQNIYRSKVSERNPKTIFNTVNTVVFSTHEPRICLGGRCINKRHNVAKASVFHYRSRCKKKKQASCNNVEVVNDTRIWNYKDELVQRATATLKLLHLI